MALEQMTPPGIQLDGPAPSKAPVMRDRGFLMEQTQRKTRTEGLVYPVDDETGLPHLLRVFHDPRITGRPEHVEENYDHSWFHKAAPQLLGLGGRAVRLSMGQRIPIGIHLVKNRRFDRLSWLPETDDEKFETAVSSISGTVSRWVIDVRRPAEDLLVRVDDTEFAYLTDPRRLHREKALKDRQASLRRDDIGQFFVQYAIERGLRGVVTDKVIERFLNTEDEDHRRELGNLILKEALKVRVEPLVVSQEKLKKKGLVRPNAPSPLVAVRKFIDKRQLPMHYPRMTEKLLAT